jgi:hypothetical protein
MQPALPHGLLFSILSERTHGSLAPRPWRTSWHAHGLDAPRRPMPGATPTQAGRRACPLLPLYLAAASTFMVVQSTSTGQQPRKLSERATVGSNKLEDTQGPGGSESGCCQCCFCRTNLNVGKLCP